MAAKRDRQATTTVTVEREVREYRVYCGCCDCMWPVATCEGWFKLLEWISTFLAFVIICAKLKYYSYQPEYNFMVFVGVTAFVFITIHIILKMTHLFERLPVVLIHPYVGVFCCLLAVVAFLSASSVVLAYAKGHGFLEASAACGYIAMFLFLFEALYLFCRVRRQQRQGTAESTKTVETVKKVETKESTDKTVDKERLSEFPP